MLHFAVSEPLCNRCGECVKECRLSSLVGVIEQSGDDLPFVGRDREQHCIRCQHCLAVCPTGALSIHGREPADSQELGPDSFPPFEQMARLVRGRRSIRRYRDENVDAGLLRRLLATLANAPTGGNKQELTFSVVADKEMMRRLQRKVTEAVTAAVRRAPAEDWFLINIAPAYLQKGPGVIFHDAPHLLIVSAPPEIYNAHEDVILALAYFELLAQSAGLGTVWFGMLKPLLQALPEIQRLLGLPEGAVYYGLLFGIPSVRFYRTVQRDDGAAMHSVML